MDFHYKFRTFDPHPQFRKKSLFLWMPSLTQRKIQYDQIQISKTTINQWPMIAGQYTGQLTLILIAPILNL